MRRILFCIICGSAYRRIVVLALGLIRNSIENKYADAVNSGLSPLEHYLQQGCL